MSWSELYNVLENLCAAATRVYRTSCCLPNILYLFLILAMYNIGALIIRIGSWAHLWYNYNREPKRITFGNYVGPYTNALQPLQRFVKVYIMGSPVCLRAFAGEILRSSWV